MYLPSVTLSVVIITHNEEANLARTLESVKALLATAREIVVVDSGSDRPHRRDREVISAQRFRRGMERLLRAEKPPLTRPGDWILVWMRMRN